MLDLNDNVSLPTKILLNTGYILLYPFIQIFKARHLRQIDKRDGYIRRSPSPLPLKPRQRGRALTMDSPATTGANLLLGLPREVRDLIWYQVLGRMVIHWWIEDRKLKGFQCREVELIERDCFLRCWIPEVSNDKDSRLGAMGLLQTCRQTYSEAINILYSGNTFIVRAPDILSHLPRMLLPRRLNSIRSLRFYYILGAPPSVHPPSRQPHNAKELKKLKNRNNYYRKTWFMNWKTLAEMEGLMKLTVELDIAGGGADGMWTVEDLEVVKSVTKPEKLSLILPETMVGRMAGEVGGPNCQVLSLFLDSDSMTST